MCVCAFMKIRTNSGGASPSTALFPDAIAPTDPKGNPRRRPPAEVSTAAATALLGYRSPPLRHTSVSLAWLGLNPYIPSFSNATPIICRRCCDRPGF